MNTRVGIVIDLDDAWLGGINYFRNLVSALYADPERKLDMVLFFGHRANPAHLKGFPDVEIVRSALLDRQGLVPRIRRRLFRLLGRDLLLQRLLRAHRIDVLSHYGNPVGKASRIAVVPWIPDFQHVHLPETFTDDERAVRNAQFRRLCTDARLVIISSASAEEDLHHLFPWTRNRSAVLRFVPDVDVPRDALPTREDLEARYGHRGPFMYVPNQYWAHKNHRVVIEALGILKQRGREITVLSTGSDSDYRNPDHFASLGRRIEELGIGQTYRRLGVVPYPDLLALMRDAVCLINPSLFEGWSTTVEESRAMDKHIILSDIPVHREQSPARSTFFDPHDPAALAAVIDAQWQAQSTPAERWVGLSSGHDARRLAFARNYQAIVSRALAEMPA